MYFICLFFLYHKQCLQQRLIPSRCTIMHTSIGMICISYCSVGFRTWSQGTPRDIRVTPKYGASRLQTTKYGQFRNDVWYNMFPQKKSNKLSLLWFLHICFFLFLSSSLSSLAYLRDLQIPTRKKQAWPTYTSYYMMQHDMQYRTYFWQILSLIYKVHSQYSPMAVWT